MTEQIETVGEETAEATTPETTTQEAPTPKQGDQSFGNLVEDKNEAKTSTPDPRDALIIEMKRELKEGRKVTSEMATALKELQASVKRGDTTVSEAKDELEALAEEFDVDPKFLKKLEGITAKRVASTFEGDVSIIKQTAAEKQAAALDADLANRFNSAMDEEPRFKDIADERVVRDYIKNVVLKRPDAQKHTMLTVLDELYGKVAKVGSIESPSTRAGNPPEAVNYDKPTAKDFERLHSKASKSGEVDEEYTNSLLERAGHFVARK